MALNENFDPPKTIALLASYIRVDGRIFRRMCGWPGAYYQSEIHFFRASEGKMIIFPNPFDYVLRVGIMEGSSAVQRVP
jgi:hypothetical protein